MGSTTQPMVVFLHRMIINLAKYGLSVWQALGLFFLRLCVPETLHQNTSFARFAGGVSQDVREKAESVEKGIAALEGATDPVMLSEGIIKR